MAKLVQHIMGIAYNGKKNGRAQIMKHFMVVAHDGNKRSELGDQHR
jgi:hypothetical protein